MPNSPLRPLTRILAALATLLSTGAVASAQAGTKPAMEISRSQARQSNRGPATWFTGTATVTPLFDPKGASQVGAALVRFEPGSRTAWHKHPLGQRLVVTEGSGWTQVEGGPVEAIHAGDVVWCPPGVRHWHGAIPTTTMAHIAIQEAQNGSPVAWMEHVTDEQYQKGPR
jgi:quercetin dioxygenase-like cupin family protein